MSSGWLETKQQVTDLLCALVVRRLLLVGCDCAPSVDTAGAMIEIHHEWYCSSRYVERRVALWN